MFYRKVFLVLENLKVPSVNLVRHQLKKFQEKIEVF